MHVNLTKADEYGKEYIKQIRLRSKSNKSHKSNKAHKPINQTCPPKGKHRYTRHLQHTRHPTQLTKPMLNMYIITFCYTTQLHPSMEFDSYEVKLHSFFTKFFHEFSLFISPNLLILAQKKDEWDSEASFVAKKGKRTEDCQHGYPTFLPYRLPRALC